MAVQQEGKEAFVFAASVVNINFVCRVFLDGMCIA